MKWNNNKSKRYLKIVNRMNWKNKKKKKHLNKLSNCNSKNKLKASKELNQNNLLRIELIRNKKRKKDVVD